MLALKLTVPSPFQDYPPGLVWQPINDLLMLRCRSSPANIFFSSHSAPTVHLSESYLYLALRRLPTVIAKPYALSEFPSIAPMLHKQVEVETTNYFW